MNANRCAPGLRTALAPAATNLSATLARTKAPFAATTRLSPFTSTRSYQDGPKKPFDGPPRGPRGPPGPRRPGPGSAPQNKNRSAFENWAADSGPARPLFKRGPGQQFEGRPPGPNRYQGGHRPPGPNRFQGGQRPPPLGTGRRALVAPPVLHTRAPSPLLSARAPGSRAHPRPR